MSSNETNSIVNSAKQLLSKVQDTLQRKWKTKGFTFYSTYYYVDAETGKQKENEERKIEITHF